MPRNGSPRPLCRKRVRPRCADSPGTTQMDHQLPATRQIPNSRWLSRRFHASSVQNWIAFRETNISRHAYTVSNTINENRHTANKRVTLHAESVQGSRIRINDDSRINKLRYCYDCLINLRLACVDTAVRRYYLLPHQSYYLHALLGKERKVIIVNRY